MIVAVMAFTDAEDPNSKFGSWGSWERGELVPMDDCFEISLSWNAEMKKPQSSNLRDLKGPSNPCDPSCL